jgi:hypothetical protein
MKDVRHEHPLNDPAHQRSCRRCQQMEVLGETFAEWLSERHLNEVIDDEVMISFFLLFVANITINSNTEPFELPAQPAALREQLLLEAGHAFDAALRDLREELEGA